MAYCPNCGKEIDLTHYNKKHNCNFCGHKFTLQQNKNETNKAIRNSLPKKSKDIKSSFKSYTISKNSADNTPKLQNATQPLDTTGVNMNSIPKASSSDNQGPSTNEIPMTTSSDTTPITEHTSEVAISVETLETSSNFFMDEEIEETKEICETPAVQSNLKNDTTLNEEIIEFNPDFFEDDYDDDYDDDDDINDYNTNKSEDSHTEDKGYKDNDLTQSPSNSTKSASGSTPGNLVSGQTSHSSLEEENSNTDISKENCADWLHNMLDKKMATHIEKKEDVNIDYDFNHDGYYNDTEPLVPPEADTISLKTIVKIIGFIFALLLIIIFLIYYA